VKSFDNTNDFYDICYGVFSKEVFKGFLCQISNEIHYGAIRRKELNVEGLFTLRRVEN
jgi:hypothetical protein